MTDSIDLFFQEWAAQMAQGDLPALPADAQYIYRMARICRIFGDRLDATCSRHDLTRSQYEAMAVMRRRHPQPMTAGDLMKAAFLTSGSVTAMLNQLRDRKLVVRKVSVQDRRHIEVQLTKAGIKLIDEAITERIQDNTALARLLPRESRAEINDLMKQFLGALETLEAQSS